MYQSMLLGFTHLLLFHYPFKNTIPVLILTFLVAPLVLVSMLYYYYFVQSFHLLINFSNNILWHFIISLLLLFINNLCVCIYYVYYVLYYCYYYYIHIIFSAYFFNIINSINACDLYKHIIICLPASRQNLLYIAKNGTYSYMLLKWES